MNLSSPFAADPALDLPTATDRLNDALNSPVGIVLMNLIILGAFSLALVQGLRILTHILVFLGFNS